MTILFTLTKGATTVDLLALHYQSRMEVDFGGVTHAAPVYRNALGDLPAFGRSDPSTPRTVPFEIWVSGNDAASLAARVSALIDVLPDDDTPSTITIKPDGSSVAGTIIARRVDGLVKKPFTAAEQFVFETLVSFSLLCDPPTYASTETIYDRETFLLPAVADLSAQTGQVAAPLDLLLDGGTLELDHAVLAHYPDASAVLADFQHEAVALSWSAGSAAEDAAGYPDLPVPSPSPIGAAWPIAWDFSPSPTYVHASGGKYHVEDDATAKNSYMRSVDFIDVLPSASYTIGCYLALITRAAAGSINCYVMWYTAAGAFLSQDIFATLNSVTGEAWIDTDITSPATAGKALLVAQTAAATGALAATVRGFDIRQRLTLWGHTAAAYADIDVTDYKPGEYLVLARCKGTVANTATFGHPYATALPIPSTTLQLLSLGVVSLPCSAVRGSGASTLRITLTGGGGGNEGYVNAVYLLPTSFGGLIGWQRAGSHAHTLCWKDGVLYADGAGDLAGAIAGMSVRTLGGSLIVLAEQATPADATAIALSIFEKPRWEQLPSVSPEMTFGALVNDGLADAIAPIAEVGGVYL